MEGPLLCAHDDAGVDYLYSYQQCLQVLHEAEAKRLEEAGTKLRNQRLEAEERKREREVKFTDRLPPPKRTRSTGCKFQSCFYLGLG